jgi:hypothetical protein
MKKWAIRLGVALTGAVVAVFVVLWFVPPAPRLTLENIDKLDHNTTEADAIELFGRPYFKGPFENRVRNVVWIEDQVLFGVTFDERGKIKEIRWEPKSAEREGFWHKFRRRVRL